MRAPWIAVAAVAAIAACGGAPSGAGLATPAVRTATPSPTVAAATPTAAPTPTPPPPLAVLLDENGSVRAVDGTGAALWTLDQATVYRTVSATPVTGYPAGTKDDIEVRTAGPNVLLERSAFIDPAAAGVVAVLDRNGRVTGTGAFDAGVGAGDVWAGPSGTEWAWSVDLDRTSSDPALQHHGRISVAGIGTAAHTVYSWVAPPGATEGVGAWTDSGIVMERFTSSGCGLDFHPDSAGFLVDPGSGAITELYSGDTHFLDARHGVHVELGSRTQSSVLVNGVAFDEPGTIVAGAHVSPDGLRVGIARLIPIPCAGGPTTYRLSTEMVTMAGSAHTDIADVDLDGWFDSARFVGHTNSSATPAVSLYGVDGTKGAALGSGTYRGTVPGT
jgi:hypothetical protein